MDNDSIDDPAVHDGEYEKSNTDGIDESEGRGNFDYDVEDLLGEFINEDNENE